MNLKKDDGTGYFDMAPNTEEKKKKTLFKRLIIELTGAKEKELEFHDIDEKLKKKIVSDSLLFFFILFLMFIFAIKLLNVAYLMLGILFLLFGSFFIYKLYYMATRNLITKINGVVIALDRNLVERRIIHVQDLNENVYRILITNNIKNFKPANEVTFFVPTEKLKEKYFSDGEYQIGTPVHIEILNAKII